MTPYRLKTFLLFEDDEKELNKVEEFDALEQLTYKMSFNEEEKIEEYYTYEGDKLIESKVIREGEEIDREVFVYEGENVIKRDHYIQAELFEEEFHEYGDGFHNRIIVQDDEVVDQEKRTYKDDKNYSLEFYSGDILDERHEYSFDEQERTGMTKVFLNDGHQSHEVTWKENEEGDQLFYQVKEGEHVIKERTSEYDSKGNLIKETSMSFEAYTSSFVQENSYDEKGRLVLVEIRTLTDQLLAFDKFVYDDNDRIIESFVKEAGNYSAVYGTFQGHDAYHYKMEYEDLV